MKHFIHFLFILCLLFSDNIYSLEREYDEVSIQEYKASIQERKASIIRLGESKYVAPNSSKMLLYDVLAATAKNGCSNKAWSNYIVKFPYRHSRYPADGPVEIFALPPLVRYLYQFGHCLTEQQKHQVVSGLSEKKQRLFGHGTLNHAILRSTSWYLLAQYFPNAKWLDWSGKHYTSKELMFNLKKLLIKRNLGIMSSGHTEWLSPTYAMVNFSPLLNLIDFSQDSEVKKIAEDEAVLELIALKASSFHGVIVPPLTRKNVDQVNALDSPQNYTPATSQHILWYYFGEPSGLQKYDFKSRKEPFFVIMLALSNWWPPNKILLMKDTNGVVKVNTPEFSIWGADVKPVVFGDSYINDDFAIGTGNQIFKPSGYSGDVQTFSILLKTNKPQNQIECYHPFWRSNGGEDLWGADRSSPFQQMHRYNQSSVVMLFDIPDKDPWANYKNNRFISDRNENMNQLLQVVTCRVPKNLDQIIREDKWLFIREGNTFIAIATLNGINYYNDAPRLLRSKYLVLKVRENKTALFFRVDVESENFKFDEFVEKVRKLAPSYDHITSTAHFIRNDGVETKVTFKLNKINSSQWSSIPQIIPNIVDSKFVLKSPFVTINNSTIKFTESKVAR